ncbi:MAG TPA: hypothetical protein VKX16_17690 [Chloroflexota bacterium]|nr:hypothetical protein [Chloroflexota bacterium]
MDNGYELVGTVVRLQVQQAPLKVGERGRRRYEPAPITAVSRLTLTRGGVTGWEADESLLDVHHRDHPAGKYQDVNGVSVGFTSHYAVMRDRFGPHLTPGVAGENILIEASRMVDAGDLRDGLVIVDRAGHPATLASLRVAEPCVEFTRYAMRYPPDAPADPAFTAALDFLRAGMRGFYATYTGDNAATIQPGDRVYRPSGRAAGGA